MFDHTGKNQDQILFPNLAEMWKQIYFKNENAWAEAFKQFIGTDTFVKMLTGTLDQHLSMEKVMRQGLDQYFDSIPLPSKKDIARVAEMVISLEDKIDVIDFEAADIIKKLTENLLIMVKAQEKTKQELEQLKTAITDISLKLDNITQLKENPKPENKKGAKKPGAANKPPQANGGNEGAAD